MQKKSPKFWDFYIIEYYTNKVPSGFDKIKEKEKIKTKRYVCIILHVSDDYAQI